MRHAQTSENTRLRVNINYGIFPNSISLHSTTTMQDCIHCNKIPSSHVLGKHEIIERKSQELLGIFFIILLYRMNNPKVIPKLCVENLWLWQKLIKTWWSIK